MEYAQKLEELRQILAAEGGDGFLVPRTDEYQGEYVPACAERLAWLTGFTGSAGLAVVLRDKAMVMSDGRYTIQLAQQVDRDLYQLVNSQDVKPEEWLKEHAHGKVIGYDPKLHTPAQIEAKEKAGVKLKALSTNPVDKIWKDRPRPPLSQVSLFPEKFAGVSAADKIQNIQKQLQEKKQDAVILTLSDSIAWLLNIRGNDIPYIPVVLSYAVVPAKDKVQWFVQPEKISADIQKALEAVVDFKAPEELKEALENLGGQHVLLDPKRTSIWFRNILQKNGAEIISGDDPCIAPRARKTTAEQAAMKAAHIRDGVALIRFLKWFEGEAPKGQLNELSVEDKLESFRAQAKEFKEPSFNTIAGYGANGAVVHYRADEKSSQTIKAGNLLLLDSGAQYEDGTTDITRTLAVGEPSAEMKECFTLVLKGHIAVASAKFKKGTKGKDIDLLARGPLREKGLDFAHGTGHGVGCYLSVHEEAANFSPRGEDEVKAGMIISNEPGFYKEGEYGIRIENLVLTQEADDGSLYFETITLCPIDQNLIIAERLNEDEKAWLNVYHEQVFETLSPHLNAEEKQWLKAHTAKI
jgi:Xaa-Pro aminopeptidase